MLQHLILLTFYPKAITKKKFNTYVKESLLLLFGLEWLRSVIMLLRSKSYTVTKTILLAFAVSVLYIYVLIPIEGCLLHLLSKGVKKRLSYTTCLTLLLPQTLVSTCIGYLYVLCMILNVYHEVGTLYVGIAQFFYGLYIVMYYLSNLYQFNKKQLLIVLLIKVLLFAFPKAVNALL